MTELIERLIDRRKTVRLAFPIKQTTVWLPDMALLGHAMRANLALFEPTGVPKIANLATPSHEYASRALKGFEPVKTYKHRYQNAHFASGIPLTLTVVAVFRAIFLITHLVTLCVFFVTPIMNFEEEF